MQPELGPISESAEERPRNKAGIDLEWSRIVSAVRERCTGPLGDHLEDIPIAETYAAAKIACAESAEAHRLRELDTPLPLDGIRDIGRSLDRLDRGGGIDGAELRAVAATLGAARALRRFLGRQRADAEALHAACSTDPTLDDLQEDLQRAVEPDGRLADGASPDLGKLRTEVANLRARIVGRLEQMLLKHADIVQDRFHTLREGRYVIPVRVDAHERLQGIVHGTSGSGATVFVEPRAVVSQGNRLKMAQAELEREEARILGLLGGRVSERMASVRAAVRALDRADLRAASARLADDLGGLIPAIVPEATIQLVGGRHPLLVLDGVDVVQNDLEIQAGEALVLSGPNAGGKTVALKVLGLAALMARAGLPVVAAEGSRVGYFAPVLTDVGDEQSIEKNLSTFSAHVTNLVRVLDAAGPSSLVLLDELATGTDPDEGAALACAVVEALCEAGAAVGVTTHYERLKAAAIDDPHLRNASVGFDVEHMAPTFRLRNGVPGSSSALAVAARFGMPERVLEKARRELPEESRAFDRLVSGLEQRYEALDAEREKANQARREAEALREQAAAALEKVRARQDKALTAEGEKLRAEIRDLRGELKRARRALRDKEQHDEQALRAIRVTLDKASESVERTAPEPLPLLAPRGEPLAASAVTVGARVYVPRLRAEVDVVETPSRGRVRVAAGPVKLWVKVEELRSLEAQPKDARPEPRRKDPVRGGSRMPSDSNSVDVRGLRVDDAIAMTESFLDRMFGAAEPVAFIVHGVGTGALRDAVRAHLAQRLPQYVSEARPGTLEEGGERVTVVVLR